MFLRNDYNSLKITIFSTIVIFIIGCEKPTPTVYEIPKEERSAKLTVQPGQNTASQASSGSKMQIVQESAYSASGINYRVPENWEELEPSGIRKGNFKINSDNGTAEVTIITFPGNAGGTLPNINRWRSQIGLFTATSEDVPEFSEPLEIPGHKGLYVRLEGETQSILGAILPVHGNTWFFKMLGDTSVVLANEAAMKQFLSSVQLTDNPH